MPDSATLISVDEYLQTGTKPACEYRDGSILGFAFEKRALRRADRSLGRFRNYLKTCLRSFAIDEYKARTETTAA